MPRTRRRLGVAILLVVAFVVAWLAWPSTGRESSPAARVADQHRTPTGVFPVSPPTLSSLRHDPRGSLRLEGQVIDADDARPIGGATVFVDSEPPRTTTTEADGSFAFDGLLARRYRVEAWKDDLYSSRIPVRVGSRSEPAILRMRRGAAIRFIVTGGQPEEPVPGARIRVDEQRTVDADAGGIALVRGLGTFFHWFEITADGWAPSNTSVMFESEGGQREIRVHLSRGAALAGTVLDPDGRPVAGATVSASLEHDLAIEAETDQKGIWRFAELAAGTYSIRAESEAWAPSDTATVTLDGLHEHDGLVLRLARGTVVSGTVLDEQGSPVAAAQVFLNDYAHGGGAAVNTDALGGFAFHGVASGHFKLYAQSDTRASLTSDVDGARGATNVKLVVSEATIAGVVVDERGAPVPEANVEGESEQMTSRAAEDGITDSNGRFELGPLPLDTYKLTAQWPGVGEENMYIRGPGVSARSGARDVRITLTAPGTITGIVRVAGKPATRYFVGVSENRYGFSTSTVVTSADGRFRRSSLHDGTWMVGIVGDDVEMHVISDVVVTAGQTTDLGVIDLPRARRLRGRVVDSAAHPVADAQVLVGLAPSTFAGVDEVSQALRGVRATSTGPDGRFDLAMPGGIVDRPPRAVAVYQGRRSAEVTVEDPGKEVVLTLAATGALRGVVQNASGDIIVTARTDDGAVGTAMADDQGAFEIDELAPGRYHVRAQNPLAGQASKTVDIDVTPTATANATLTMPAGGITLVVHGAHVDAGHCFVSVIPVDGPVSQEPIAYGSCAAEVELEHVPPGQYRLCINDTCQPASVTTSPERQVVDVR